VSFPAVSRSLVDAVWARSILSSSTGPVLVMSSQPVGTVDIPE
jgi:hypothetical protein